MRYVQLNDGLVVGIFAAPQPDIQVIEAPDVVGLGWGLAAGEWVSPAVLATLDDRRAAKLATITATAEALLAGGATLSDGLHIALDDGSRADLTAMAATATAAASGAVSWPDSYSRGWISVENVRIPLATPAAGLALAASVGGFYARVVQYRRDLKDAALAATTADALAAIDIDAGWPV